MKVLFAGKYNREYNRTRIIIKGLGFHGCYVGHFPFSPDLSFDTTKFVEVQKRYDIVFFPSFSHKSLIAAAKYLNKPVLFDPLISRYMTFVRDYRNYPVISWGALKNFYRDKKALKTADFILADTKQHKDYFSKLFKIDPARIEVLPIGVDTEIFHPLEDQDKTENEYFTVGYVGGYIPLHGIEKIARTIYLLKEEKKIRFVMIGQGRELPLFEKLCKKWHLESVELIPWLPENMLPEHISRFDLCLGIFGDSVKAYTVIPNKVYEYSAMGKSTITMDSPAIREIFTDDENIFLCPHHPEAMAKKIKEIYKSPELNRKVAGKAFELIVKNYSEKEIGKLFLKIANKCIDS